MVVEGRLRREWRGLYLLRLLFLRKRGWVPQRSVSLLIFELSDFAETISEKGVDLV